MKNNENDQMNNQNDSECNHDFRFLDYAGTNVNGIFYCTKCLKRKVVYWGKDENNLTIE